MTLGHQLVPLSRRRRGIDKLTPAVGPENVHHIVFAAAIHVHYAQVGPFPCEAVVRFEVIKVFLAWGASGSRERTAPASEHATIFNDRGESDAGVIFPRPVTFDQRT